MYFRSKNILNCNRYYIFKHLYYLIYDLIKFQNQNIPSIKVTKILKKKVNIKFHKWKIFSLQDFITMIY